MEFYEIIEDKEYVEKVNADINSKMSIPHQDKPKKDDSKIVAGDYCFQKITLPENEAAIVEQEADAWQLIEEGEYTKILYWHDDDEESGTFEHEHPITIAVVKDGHFIGTLISIKNTSSFGLSVHYYEDNGVLFTDGTTSGEISTYFSHCSTEVDSTERTWYSLRKK